MLFSSTAMKSKKNLSNCKDQSDELNNDTDNYYYYESEEKRLCNDFCWHVAITLILGYVAVHFCWYVLGSTNNCPTVNFDRHDDKVRVINADDAEIEKFVKETMATIGEKDPEVVALRVRYKLDSIVSYRKDQMLKLLSNSDKLCKSKITKQPLDSLNQILSAVTDSFHNRSKQFHGEKIHKTVIDSQSTTETNNFTNSPLLQLLNIVKRDVNLSLTYTDVIPSYTVSTKKNTVRHTRNNKKTSITTTKLLLLENRKMSVNASTSVSDFTSPHTQLASENSAKIIDVKANGTLIFKIPVKKVKNSNELDLTQTQKTLHELAARSSNGNNRKSKNKHLLTHPQRASHTSEKGSKSSPVQIKPLESLSSIPSKQLRNVSAQTASSFFPKNNTIIMSQTFLESADIPVNTNLSLEQTSGANVTDSFVRVLVFNNFTDLNDQMKQNRLIAEISKTLDNEKNFNFSNSTNPHHNQTFMEEHSDEKNMMDISTMNTYVQTSEVHAKYDSTQTSIAVFQNETQSSEVKQGNQKDHKNIYSELEYEKVLNSENDTSAGETSAHHISFFKILLQPYYTEYRKKENISSENTLNVSTVEKLSIKQESESKENIKFKSNRDSVDKNNSEAAMTSEKTNFDMVTITGEDFTRSENNANMVETDMSADNSTINNQVATSQELIPQPNSSVDIRILEVVSTPTNNNQRVVSDNKNYNTSAHGETLKKLQVHEKLKFSENKSQGSSNGDLKDIQIFWSESESASEFNNTSTKLKGKVSLIDLRKFLEILKVAPDQEQSVEVEVNHKSDLSNTNEFTSGQSILAEKLPSNVRAPSNSRNAIKTSEIYFSDSNIQQAGIQAQFSSSLKSSSGQGMLPEISLIPADSSTISQLHHVQSNDNIPVNQVKYSDPLSYSADQKKMFKNFQEYQRFQEASNKFAHPVSHSDLVFKATSAPFSQGQGQPTFVASDNKSNAFLSQGREEASFVAADNKGNASLRLAKAEAKQHL